MAIIGSAARIEKMLIVLRGYCNKSIWWNKYFPKKMVPRIIKKDY